MKVQGSRFKVLALTVCLPLLLAPEIVCRTVHAADDEAQPRKTLVLPKSARAAAYVLGRLSNKELIEAPRSEFVYVAMLERKGLERKYRVEALEGLAKARNTDPLTELIGGLRELDGKGAESEPVLRDLAALVVQAKPADLAPRRPDLDKLAADAQLPFTRQVALAGTVTADGTADRAWQQAASEPARLADLLYGIPLLKDAALRGSLYPKIEPLLHMADPAEVRRAAITAVPAVPGHDGETFNTLSSLVRSGTERAAAVQALERIPKKAWPPEQAGPLLASVENYLQSVPVDQRTGPEAVNALQLATDLSTLLPPDQARAAAKRLRALGPSVFLIRTIPEQMLYDRTLLVVEPGKPVEIVLQNDDAMQHNLVVVRPGALEEIGQAAEKMAPQPDAYLRLYVPDSPKVLFATRLLDPGQTVKLAFTAPAEPGEYPYLCSYPGHWRRMVGTLAVAPDVEAYLAAHAAAEPKVTEWKLEDLAPDLARAGAGRNLAAGRELFTKLACVQCHKLGPDGYAYGPDLGDVLKRYNNDLAEVLRQILEPSLKVDDRYRNYQFELKDGDEFSGMIVKEEGDTLTVQTGPSDALIRSLKKSDIKERQPQGSSLMPLGLLNTLSRDQILDLLSYLQSGGALQAHEHKH